MSESTNQKYSTIHYHNYLGLDKVLGAQDLRSASIEDKGAHEEMLFIVVHQVYELWFKQIIHELSSVIDMFKKNEVDERNMGTASARLDRVNIILEHVVSQIKIMESMTPLDFLDFRNYLFPASGFQSFQFRLIENMMGLPEQQRLTYNNHHYASVFTEEQQSTLNSIQKSGSLFTCLESWLERTPFIKFGDFKFLDEYRLAVERMIKKEEKAIRNSDYLTDDQKEMRVKMLGSTDSYFESVLDPTVHARLKAEGVLRLSYKATVAALFINLYRDEPILQLPFKLLISLVEMDATLTTWRYRHAQMVLRMLGNKIGTGGSSGHGYLNATAEKNHIFKDLHNISTLLIPRSELPKLPEQLKKELSFYYSEMKA